MEKIRSFIAIELPTSLQDELAGLQQRWHTPGQNFVKWVDPHSIHLTLKFLGYISPRQVTPLEEVLAEAAGASAPFHVCVSGCGVFPHTGQPQVAWVGVEGDLTALIQLQRAIDSNLAKLGFPPEKRAFKPHLTLGRLRHNTTPQQARHFGKLVSSTELDASERIKVNSVNLMKSTLTRNGAVYSRLASLPLSGGTGKEAIAC